MVHLGGGLLNELENDLERLVVSVENRPNGLGGYGGQQPMGYGQTMYAPGAMGYAPAVVAVPYQQQGYGMQPQMMGMGMQQQQMMPGYGAQQARGPLAMPSYGQGYAQAGPPPMMYGGPNDALMPQSGQQAYGGGAYQGYAPGQQQQYAAAAPQQAYGQAYAQPQPAYQQPQQAYAAAPQPPAQPAPQQTYAPAPQAPPQQAYAQPQQPAPQQPAPQQAPQQSYAPAAQPAPQPAQQQAYAQAPQPAAQPAPQGTPQPAPSPAPLNPAQPATTYDQQSYSRAPQQQPPPAADPAQYRDPSRSPYQPAAAAAPQPTYQPTNPSGYANNVQPAPARYGPSAASQVPSYQQGPVPSYGAQPTMLLAAVPRAPNFLNLSDYQVRYEPTSAKVDTHHHALKALDKSSQTAEAMTAIVGSYLALKQAHEMSHMSGTGTYRHSRQEVQTYSHSMDKLESLSADFVSKHKNVPPAAWLVALGAHRRHVFATLYNSNELVRGFCSEVPGGPLALPELDAFALGKPLTSLNFARATSRLPNISASFSVLSQVRTVVLVDDSGSMTEPGHTSWGGWSRGRETRWSQARDLLSGLAPLVAQHSPHGIDIHFLNRVPFYAGLRSGPEVDAAFDSDYPSNGTPTGQRVNDILDAYMCALRHYRKMLPLNLIIITDGEAQDEHILHWTIEHHVAKNVHRGFPAHQFGIEFVQVGDCEYATRHLERLEEEVSRHHHRFQRDVVGVTPVTRIGRMDAEKLLGISVSGIDARMNGYMRSRGVNL